MCGNSQIRAARRVKKPAPSGYKMNGSSTPMLAPTSVTLTPLGAVSGANLSISASDGLTFTVTYTGPTLSTIFEFRWRADCELV